MRSFASCFDTHAPVFLLVFAITFLLSGCMSQPADKGFETRLTVPASGEIIFK